MCSQRPAFAGRCFKVLPMRNTLLIALLLAAPAVNAQVQTKPIRRAQHSIQVSYLAQYCLNKTGVKGDNVYGFQPIKIKNNFGYNWSLDYQRASRSGFLLSIGPHLGAVYHNVRFQYNIGYVDMDVPELNGLAVDTGYAFKLSYVGLKLMAGYRWRSPIRKFSNWDMDLKAGISARNFTSYTNYRSGQWTLSYNRVDSFYFGVPVSSEYINFGDKQPIGSEMTYLLHAYLGVNGNINALFLRNVTFGLEATWSRHGGGVGAQVHLFGNNEKYPLESHNRYSNTGISVGLKVGMGLWP